jgi:hypothetical protein
MKYSPFMPLSGNIGVKGTSLPATRVTTITGMPGVIDWQTQVDGLGRPEDYATWTGVAQNLLRDDQFGPAWALGGGGLINVKPKQAGFGYAQGIEPYFLEIVMTAGAFGSVLSEKVSIEAEQRVFFSTRISRGTTASGTVGLYARWLTDTGTFISDVLGGNWNASTFTAGESPKEFTFSLIAPPTARYVQLLIVHSNDGTTGHTYRLEAPRISNVGPTHTIAGESTHTVYIGSDGTSVISGLPFETRLVVYRDNVAQNFFTSGFLWTYTVLSGGINGRTSANAPFGMGSVDGVGQFNLDTVEASESTIKITATKYGTKVDHFLTVIKNVAPGVSGGSSGGTTSTTNLPLTITSFTGVNLSNTTFQDLTGTINGVMPAGKTTANVTVDMNIKLSGAGSYGNSNIFEVKAQRFVGGVWTDMDAPLSNEAYRDIDGETGTNINSPARFTFVHQDTGLTAGSAQQFRVVGRTTTATTGYNSLVSGSVVVSAP